MGNLNDIYTKHGTDKGGKLNRYGDMHNYGDFYEMFFEKYRGRHATILELGVQHGESVLAHDEYFKDAEIYGVDIDLGGLEFDTAAHPNLHMVLGSSVDPMVYSMLEFKKFDIIIDDASHFHEDMVRNFAMYSKLVGDGGIYVIEDLHCDFDTFFNDGADSSMILNMLLRHTHSSLLTDEENRELLSSIQQVFIYEYVNNSDIVFSDPCKGSSITAVVKFKNYVKER